MTDFSRNPQVLAADPDRRSLSRNEWIKEFFTTSSSPVGHGFSKENVNSGFACYSFEPDPKVPLKVIVLDDTQGESDPAVGSYAFGSLDQNRYRWLVGELDRGQADGRLMIITAHVPIGVGESPLSSAISMWSPFSPVGQDTLPAKLHTYPNLLLWVAGHRHCNVITALKSPDPTHPELGFWQIETSSLRDFPQQFSTVAINRNAVVSMTFSGGSPRDFISVRAKSTHCETSRANALFCSGEFPHCLRKVKSFFTSLNNPPLTT